MGRITVFSIDACPYCELVKHALEKRNIPYTEISLTKHPEKRDDLYNLSQRRSLPQVFFNTRHVGGADDTLKVLKEWDTNPKYKSPRDRYEAEIGRQPEPGSPGLRIPVCCGSTAAAAAAAAAASTRHVAPLAPDEKVIMIPPPPRPMKRERTLSIVLPNGKKAVSVMEITELLKTILPISDRKHGLSMYRNCFRGNDAVKAFAKHFQIPKDEAVEFGKELLSHEILHHVLHEHQFENSPKFFYRLHCHQTPDVLNSYRVWNTSSKVDSEQLLTHLEALLATVEADMTRSQKDVMVDYKNACKHEKYIEFEETVCGLQSVNLRKFNDKEMLVFGMNLYKVMLKYSFMKVGIATTELSRLAQLNSVKFEVGGYIFSLHDWYNGILRGNRRAPHSLMVPFGKKDPRRELALKNVDPRIHFALNNLNSRSCTPIQKFTVDNIDKELEIVAQAFCEDDGNVSVNSKSGEVHLSEMFRWYHADFTNNTNNHAIVVTQHINPEEKNHVDLLQVLLRYLHGNKQFYMKRLLSSPSASRKSITEKSGIKVVFSSGNIWSKNASEFVPFERRNIAAREKGLHNLVRIR